MSSPSRCLIGFQWKKAKLKVYDGRRITPCGKVSLTCKYKGKFTVMDFVLVKQHLPSILGLKSCLDLSLIKRIHCLEKENLESEYADVFEGLDEIKGSRHTIHIDPKRGASENGKAGSY